MWLKTEESFGGIMEDEGRKGARDMKVICAYCKTLLRSEELWGAETEARHDENRGGISHGICPDCLLYHFPSEYLAIQEERRIRIRNLFKKTLPICTGISPNRYPLIAAR